ncbi:MAG: hypothetical protein ACAI43_11555 [Phycisphaerae bacterium]
MTRSVPAKFSLGLALGLACACVSCGGQGPKPNIYGDDPAEQIPGMKKAAREGDRKVVPELVKQLESDDAAIRFYAIESLKRLTGQDLGYRYFEDEPGRKDAVERWKAWEQTTAKP